MAQAGSNYKKTGRKSHWTVPDTAGRLTQIYIILRGDIHTQLCIIESGETDSAQHHILRGDRLSAVIYPEKFDSAKTEPNLKIF